MTDDQTSKAPNQDIMSSDVDTDTERASDAPKVQIFDITPDLNISPAKDEVENQIPVNIPEIITTPLITPVSKKETLTQQFGPANPPAKTIGLTNISAIKTEPDQPTTLQEAVKKDWKIDTEKPKIIKNDPNIKTIRTYERDFAEAIAKKHISTASFVIAEDKKREADKITIPSDKTDIINNSQKTRSRTKRGWILSILSLILICGGIFSAYYLYTKSPLASIENNLIENKSTISNVPKSIVPPDSQITINVEDLNQGEIISNIQTEIQKQHKENSIHEILIIRKNSGLPVKITTNEALAASKINAPDIFSRSLTSDWMLGIYSGTNNQNNLFLILKNDFFQNAFAGIIQWEKMLPEDLKPHLFKTAYISKDENGSTTQQTPLRGQYKDRIIKNKDVREYVAENDHIIFLYSFISNDKLIITDSEQALVEVVSRLEKNSFVR